MSAGSMVLSPESHMTGCWIWQKHSCDEMSRHCQTSRVQRGFITQIIRLKLNNIEFPFREQTCSLHILYVLSAYWDVVANLLANSCLLTHPADTEQQQHPNGVVCMNVQHLLAFSLVNQLLRKIFSLATHLLQLCSWFSVWHQEEYLLVVKRVETQPHSLR